MFGKSLQAPFTLGFKILLILLPLFILLPGDNRILFYLNTHANKIMLGVFFLGMLFFILNQRSLMLYAFASASAIALYFWMNHSMKVPESVAIPAESLRVLHLHADLIREEGGVLQDYLWQHPSDVVILQQADSAFWELMDRDSVSPLPYRVHFHARDNHLGILSRFEPEEPDTLSFQGMLGLSVELNLDIFNREIFLFTVLIPPGVVEQDLEAIRNFISMVARESDRLHFPVLVGGMFSLASWSQPVLSLKSKGHLIESRSSLNPTLGSMFQWPDDLFFHNSSLECTGYEPIYSAESRIVGEQVSYSLRQ